jgi:tetratricopeptide (TPR) repeat protein
MAALIVVCCCCCLTASAQTARVSQSAVHQQLSDARRYDMLFLEAMVQRQKDNDDAAFDLLSRCVELNPQASEAYYFLAQYYAQMKEEEKTLAYLEKAAQLSPDNPTYMETLADTYISQEQYDKAVAVIEKLLETNKNRDDLLDMLYRLHRHQKQYKEAIAVLDRMEVNDGKSERLSALKSALYVDMDDMPSAIKEMKTLADQYPNDLNYLRLYADMLRSDGKLDEAYEIYQRILKEEPNNSQAQMSLRSYYLVTENYEAADSLTHHLLLNENTELMDKLDLLRRVIGQSEAEGGDSTRVLDLFHQMLAQPQKTSDIAELCAAYMDLKKMPRDSVAAMLERVLQIAPDNAGARLRLVGYAWEADDNERIIELCKAARQYNPDEMAFYYYQGLAYYREDDHDNALNALQNGISVIKEDSNPSIVSDFYAIMGDLLHQKGRESEAYEAYDSCLQWKPDNYGCLNNYAYFLSEKGQQLDRAEDMSFKAIKAEPKNATYLDTYAWILFMKKRYSEARIYIDRAMANDTSTTSGVITEHAGDIYAMCGLTAEAVELWQKALPLDPKNKVLIRKIKRKKYIKQ